jgi:hypothetical protein
LYYEAETATAFFNLKYATLSWHVASLDAQPRMNEKNSYCWLGQVKTGLKLATISNISQVFTLKNGFTCETAKQRMAETASRSCNNDLLRREARSVQFGAVEIREFPMIMGDHPGVRKGKEVLFVLHARRCW